MKKIYFMSILLKYKYIVNISKTIYCFVYIALILGLNNFFIYYIKNNIYKFIFTQNININNKKQILIILIPLFYYFLF